MQPFTIDWFFTLIILTLPAYATNSSALYFDPGRKGGPTTPSDFGIKFIDGRPLLGSKSVEGAIASVLFGVLTGALIGWLNLIPLGFTFDEWLEVSFFQAVGMHAGDRIGSFFKRRMDIKSGEPFEYMDQLSFIVVALAFATAVQPRIAFSMGIEGYLAIIFLTYFVHKGSNRFANAVGLKGVPW
jgi:CDP-2,3-bis-(O-geranylgeranyl)-sn-glycerol synthase